MDTSEFPQRLNDLATGYQHSQILFTALRAGIFEHLSEPTSARTVAESLAWSERGTRMLLDGLVALGLVEKSNGHYKNAAIAEACLVPGAPQDQTNILRHKADSWMTWGRLEEAVRTGSQIPRKRSARSEEERRDYILGMANIARKSAREILEAVDLSPYRRFLDIGAGPGAYSIAFLKAHPEMRATLFDLPEVIPITREQVEQAGLADRCELVTGDFMTDSFKPGFDLALLSNIIHIYDPETNRRVIHKCADALQSGGTLIIKDFLLDEDRTGPPFGLVFALHMLLHTEGGDSYSIAETEEWCAEAGLTKEKVIPLTPQTRLLLARKP